MSEKIMPLPEDFLENVDAYLDGSLSPDKIDDFEHLYFSNDACFDELVLRRELRALMQAEGDSLISAADGAPAPTPATPVTPATPATPQPNITGQKREYMRHEWQKKWKYFYAAAAIFIILLLSKVFFFSPKQSTIAANVQNTLNLSELVQEYGDLYNSDPYFEMLMKVPLRSNLPLTVESPQTDAVMENSLTFQWRHHRSAAGDTDALKLSIFRRSDEIVFQQMLGESPFLFENSMEPGVYYWLLESSADTVSLGRFYVLPEKAPQPE